MTEDINAELIKKTQNSLSKYLKESLLNEKFLKKPPFRYLQDVVKAVIKETGFLADVFTSDDFLDYSKDKERKLTFLKKLISAVQDATGNSLSARPNKIIAGLEVPKTLELLQEIGKGINLKENGVKKIGTKREETKEKKKRDSSVAKETTKKLKPKKEVETPKGDENSKENKDRVRKKKVETKEENVNEIKETKEKKRRAKPEKEVPRESKERKDIKKGEEKKKESRRSSAEKNHTEKKGSLEKQSPLDENKGISSSRKGSYQDDEVKLDGTSAEVKKDTKSEIISISDENVGNEINSNSAKPPRKRSAEAKTDAEPEENGKDEGKPDHLEKKEETEEKNDVKKKEKRPSSKKLSSKARPSSKTMEKGEKHKKESEVPLLGSTDNPVAVPKIERPKTARKAPPSARPGAPKARDRGEVKQEVNPNITETEAKPVPLIIESEAVDDDKENMVVLEAENITDNDLQANDLGDLEDDIIGENEGALVAQILETKRELEESSQNWKAHQQLQEQQYQPRNVEIEWEGGKKQKREASMKEVTKVKEGIQQLTRATNPLGKLFDFLQEDVDSMQRELKVWTETNANYSKQLKQEQKMTEMSLETYRRQLADLDSLIEQEQEAVRNLKANIIANDKKILTIVTRAN